MIEDRCVEMLENIVKCEKQVLLIYEKPIGLIPFQFTHFVAEFVWLKKCGLGLFFDKFCVWFKARS